MISMSYMFFEISDLNKQRLGVAGRAGLVGVVGTSIYKKIHSDDPKRINIYNSATPIKTISDRQYDPTLYNQIHKIKGDE